MDNEGPIVAKVYFVQKNVPVNIKNYKRFLDDTRHNFSLLKFPNIMPYQVLYIDTVLFLLQ